MAKKKGDKQRKLYLRRLAGNEYVQNQLGNAAEALSKAYRRVARGGSEAVEDKQLYSHLREAATSVRNAARAQVRRGGNSRWRGRDARQQTRRPENLARGRGRRHRQPGGRACLRSSG